MNMHRHTDREFPRAKEQTLILLTVTSGSAQVFCFSCYIKQHTATWGHQRSWKRVYYLICWLQYPAHKHMTKCLPFPSRVSVYFPLFYYLLLISLLIDYPQPLCHYAFSRAEVKRSGSLSSCQQLLNELFRKAEVIQGTTKTSLRSDLSAPPAVIHNGRLISEQTYSWLFCPSVTELLLWGGGGLCLCSTINNSKTEKQKLSWWEINQQKREAKCSWDAWKVSWQRD